MSPDAPGLNGLARSGWWTAAARAWESQRSDRLFSDLWAAVLVGRQAVDDFERAIADHGVATADLHAVITRFFDDFLLRLTGSDGVQQVVLVACGLDTRAFRLPWPPQTRLFEVDQPEVVAYKDRTFSVVGATPNCERHTVGVNLDEDWADAV